MKIAERSSEVEARLATQEPSGQFIHGYSPSPSGRMSFLRRLVDMWRDHGHKKCRQSAPTGPIDLQLQSETIDGPYGQYRLNISAILTPSDRDFLAYFADGLSPIFTYYDPLGFPIGFDLSCLLRPRSVDFRTQQELEEAQSLLVETVRRLTMPCEIT